MGRTERRAQERRHRAELFSELPASERQYARRLLDGKITPQEVKRLGDAEFKRGYGLAAKEVVAQAYAAAAIAVKRVFNATAEQAADFLVVLDGILMNDIDSKATIDRALEEAGVELDFTDPFATVKAAQRKDN